MFGSAILEVALGMAFLYALLSLIASAVREGGETILKARAKDLERGIGELLGDRSDIGVKKWLYEHPVIAGLYKGSFDQTNSFFASWIKPGTKLPTYIPSGHFAQAILDLAARGTATAPATDGDAVTTQSIRAGILANMAGHPDLQRALLVALDTAGDSLIQARSNVEAWFDGGMDRVSGWYKRRTQIWLIVIGTLVAVLMNIDSLRIVNALSTNDSLRKAVVAQAETAAKGVAPGAGQPGSDGYDALKARLEGLGLPVGWQIYTDKPFAALKAECLKAAAADASRQAGCKARTLGFATAEERSVWTAAIADGVSHGLLGWLITAFAISFGAPFWFDVLNKIMVVRSTVKPGEKSGGDTAGVASTKN